MTADLLEMYRRAGEWTAEKVAGAADLDVPTPCTEWSLRRLLDHMLETQRYFASAARGEDASPPGPNPPSLVGDYPVADLDRARTDVVEAFSAEGVVEKTGPLLGIAFADQLLHGWDVARATGQDATKPDGLAEAAYDHIHGRFTDEQRTGVFGPEVQLEGDLTAQERLLAYTGRDPR
jgi:uncharacterized protein (TIGR03086 family)